MWAEEIAVRSTTFRLAIVGLLLARSPRCLRTPLAFMALGAILVIVLLVMWLATVASPQ
jgi:hypothetical protein